jgi:hypothetical protein
MSEGNDLPHAPATSRNRQAIADAFLVQLSSGSRVLEVASGTGEHGVHFCTVRPDLVWHLSDATPQARAQSAAWVVASGLENLKGPHPLDVLNPDEWVHFVGEIDHIFCANMIHIAPLSCTPGLLLGGAHILPSGGALYLYGPFLEGEASAPSNLAFDADLKSRNPNWGVRDLEAVCEIAHQCGLDLAARRTMPANNLLLTFMKGI